ncbi:MAG: TPM domain-containing protein [Myxococcales bacterium]|nr:TPM domain-containing protein [Myxococcota bacterium]MDW8281454.1 TPM domain-containing protein [Myxococcales bacterium]
MSRPLPAAVAAALLLVVGLGHADDQLTLPAAPLGRVTDLAGVLSPGERKSLEARLRRYELQGRAGQRGPQIAVVTLPTLAGEPIEEVSIRLAERWKIGSRADDGILLVVAPRERRVRIEVGYGLEGQVPDAVAARIIREIIAPRLRVGDYFGGLTAGVVAVHQAATGQPITGIAPVERVRDASQPQRRRGDGGLAGGGLLLLLLLGLLLLAGSGGRGFLLGMLFGSLLGGRRDGNGDVGGGSSEDTFSGGGGSFGGGGASGDY